MAVVAALLAVAGTGLSGCEAAQLRAEAGEKAAEAAATWSDPAVQKRGSTAVVVQPPLFQAPTGTATDLVLASVRRGLVAVGPTVGDEPGNGVVVWATGAPGNGECAAAVTKVETCTLHAPIADRPVIDSIGGLVLPETTYLSRFP